MKNYFLIYITVSIFLLPQTAFGSQTPQDDKTSTAVTVFVSKIIAQRYKVCVESGKTPTQCAKEVKDYFNRKNPSSTSKVVTDPTYSPDSSWS